MRRWKKNDPTQFPGKELLITARVYCISKGGEYCFFKYEKVIIENYSLQRSGAKF